MYEDPDVALFGHGAEVLLEPCLLRVAHARGIGRRGGAPFERVEHRDVHWPVIERAVCGPVRRPEPARVRRAAVGHLVVAEGRNDGRLGQELALLFEPDAPRLEIGGVRHHVPGVERELRMLRGRRPRDQRVIAGVAAVIAVDEERHRRFGTGCRSAAEDEAVGGALDPVAVLRRGVQRRQGDAVVRGRRGLLHQLIRLRGPEPHAPPRWLCGHPGDRELSRQWIEQPGAHHDARRRKRRRGAPLQPGDLAHVVAPFRSEQEGERTQKDPHGADLTLGGRHRPVPI